MNISKNTVAQKPTKKPIVETFLYQNLILTYPQIAYQPTL